MLADVIPKFHRPPLRKQLYLAGLVSKKGLCGMQVILDVIRKPVLVDTGQWEEKAV
jgi:hypothetical protein